MMEVDQFNILEEKVVKLLDAYTTLGKEKATLDKTLAMREMEIKGLKEKIIFLSKGRETARHKIEGMISRIENLVSPRKME